MLRKLIALTLVAFTFLVAGCNTMAGAGQDIERGGQKLENAAERNR